MARQCESVYEGTVMTPIQYPAYGQEPTRISVRCGRDFGHEGKHFASDVVYKTDAIEWEDKDVQSRVG